MNIDREPNADEAMAVAWWASLTEAARADWMARAGDTGVVADAWAAFQAREQLAPGGSLEEEERRVRDALAQAARLMHEARLRAERCGWGSIRDDMAQVEAGIRALLRDAQ